MARPNKGGLDYFPFDVDFATNAKVEAIMGEFGAKGVLLMIYLLSAVYQKGYYLQWNKLQQMQLVNRVSGSSPDMINQIVNRLIAYGTFDEELFNSAKVLTSLRIQNTYLDATKRRKQPKPTEYWINVDINHKLKGVNDDINPQSKVKKSKVNQINVNSAREEFTLKVWPLFPKRQKFEKAFEAYLEGLKSGATEAQIVAGIKDYAAYLKVKNKGDGYTATPDHWLEDKRWLDKYDMTPEQPGPKGKQRAGSFNVQPNTSFNDDDLPF